MRLNAKFNLSLFRMFKKHKSVNKPEKLRVFIVKYSHNGGDLLHQDGSLKSDIVYECKKKNICEKG